MKTSILIICLMFLSSPALAKDISYDTSQGRSVGRDGSLAIKGFFDKRTTTSTRTATTSASGGESTSGSMERLAGQATSGGGVDVVMPAAIVFLEILAEAEEQDKSQNGCKPITAPLFAGAFGLGAEIAPGLYDATYADMLGKAGQSGSQIRNVGGEDKAIKEYISCLAWYGAAVGQAQLNLAADLATLKSTVGRDDQGAIKVEGIGFDDFVMLAKAALIKVSLEGVINPTLKALQRRASHERGPCKFAGTSQVVQCGSSALNFSDQSLSIGGIKFYGGGTFGGASATYKINRGWSYLASLEDSKGSSSFGRWSSETAKTVDVQVSKGKGVDAVNTLKRSTNKNQTGKQSVNTSAPGGGQ